MIGANALNDPALAEVVRRLVDALQPQRIYLFGSRARSDAGSDSDYDLLIVMREMPAQPFLLEQRAYRALWGLQTPVDIVLTTQSRFERRCQVLASLAATVEREGSLLYAA